ncbi:hypothetical protein [Mycolicibacterium aichiense]|uniref:Uncharacterized protein n=1 Tax=Mycolicibacterium aichiense TaxID=1799 RepID=A0AAD1HNM3_9MYCO|nr:hypothetical protein [Mycolicibacterium aichiense]MCV7020517.1 hypothetical protein [Mycolicibacterium aichiense]BBX08030.1 hypothetical protein MAIC_28330 [Mycolicibacterium aichiense]STZ81839.1 Uncharacterised protein [Mycolicibacterium aichiense]
MSETTTEPETAAVQAAAEQPQERTTIVVRHVLERQIAAGQALSSQLLDVATDVTTAIAHAPAAFAGAIQDGETIAAAWERTGTGVQDVVDDARGRLRAAVVSYVGHQATLPVAVLGYAGEVAGSVASAQGTLAGSALDGAFAVAAAATQGDDVRAALGRNIEELRATATAARGDVNESVKRAGREVREAVGGDVEPLVAAITGAGEDS